MSNIPLGKFGGTLVVTTIGEGPKTFNPWESRDATSSQIGELLYDSLVTTNVLNGEVIPKLAYDFKLYKTVDLQLSGGVQNILEAYQKDFDRGANRDSGYIYGPALPRSFFAGVKISY